jgi:hypothetical protein
VVIGAEFGREDYLMPELTPNQNKLVVKAKKKTLKIVISGDLSIVKIVQNQ